MSGMLALIEPPRSPDDVPAHLRRPGCQSAMATLSLTDEPETEDGGGGKRWRLEGSPAVVLTAVKIMPGAWSRKNNLVSWPAVQAGFEDLLMLMQRYPVLISQSAAAEWERQYGEAIASWRAQQSPLDQLDARDATFFRGKLLPFQRDGVAFMLAGRRCLLADDMGLGKTVQAFAFLDLVSADWPVVIVCQAHVQRHWEGKIEEFLDCRRAGAPLLTAAGGLTWFSCRGTKPSKMLPKADVYIVHYLVLASWEQFLRERGVRTVIFDEVQELRHKGTGKYSAAFRLSRQAHNVVGLSGTPIYNHGIEIYTILNTLNRGCLGTKYDFQAHWTHGGEVVPDPALLGQYLRDRRLMLRRRKADVLNDLPEKRRVIEMIDADNKKFAELVKEAAKLAREALFQKEPFDRARMEAEAMAQTRMATGIAKAPAVVAFLRALMEAGDPTLVFAHHHAVHEAISTALDAFNPVAITGIETMAQKAKNQEAFQNGETNLCLIALRAATGIDGLQKRARVVVFAELDWSPAVHRQAEDRAHRMGQKNGVMVYYLVTDVGVDPHMINVLNVKEAQFMGLMHEVGESEEDHLAAKTAAKQHMDAVMAMLREQAP